jgi:hypothetical protein
MIIEAGNVTAEAGLAVNVIVAPLAGAAALNATVHEEVAGGANATGLHANPLSPGLNVTVPAVVDVARAVPVGTAADVFARCNWEDASEV